MCVIATLGYITQLKKENTDCDCLCGAQKG
jgi:hypothetical protein